MLQIDFKFNGAPVPFSSLPVTARKELSAFGRGGLPRNMIRKAFYSDLVEMGAGHEVLALVFEHGANAILPHGPLSFYPLNWILAIGQQFMDMSHSNAGIDLLFDELSQAIKTYGAPTVQEVADDSETLLPEFAGLPGISFLPVAISDECVLINSAANEIARTTAQSRCSDDYLRTAIAIELCRNGVPLVNLRRFQEYYTIDSFVQVHDELFFVAVIAQNDVGMGLLPLPLRASSSLIRNMVQRLRGTGRRALFYGRSLSDREFGSTISRGLAVNGSTSQQLARMLKRVSNLAGLYNFGGLLTAALASLLAVKPNYYDIGDLINAHRKNYELPLNVWGEPWANPYRPSREQLQNRLGPEKMAELAINRNIAGDGGRGRRRRLGGQFCGHPSSWTDEAFTQFVALYDCWPQRDSIEVMLILATGVSATCARRKATRIFRKLSSQGRIRAGRPQRMVPIEFFDEFLENYVVSALQPSAPRHADLAIHRIGQIRLGAALGVRISETLRSAARDHIRIGNYDQIHIHGTKNHRASRDVPIWIAQLGPQGSILTDRLLDCWKERAGIVTDGPLFGREKEAAQRASDALTNVLDSAFRSFRGIPAQNFSGEPQVDGRFTHHSLRHHAGIRMLQGAIDGHLSNGNFWVVVSEIAFALGQSPHTLLSSYLGTAALTLLPPPGVAPNRALP